VRTYTPHGGSFNYRPGSGAHALYMAAERTLARATDVFLFESRYIAARFSEQVGHARALQRIVCNGISAAECEPVAPRPDAADFLYVGELRSAKGIDTLLAALAVVSRDRGTCPRTVLVGSGPDQQELLRQAQELGLGAYVSFPGPMPAREAFALGRTLLVPSRAESLPYIVLEAAGARVPMIATNVGGIPEIFGPHAHRLIPCDDVPALAASMQAELDRPARDRAERAEALGAFVETHFTISNMADAVISGYSDAMALRDMPAGAVASSAQ
jgi:glycosyltransferase involved in cell wall biosynthesis